MWPQNRRLNNYQFTADYLEVEFDIGCNDFIMHVTLTSGHIIYVKFNQRYLQFDESALEVFTLEQLAAVVKQKTVTTTDINGTEIVFELTDQAAGYLIKIISIIKELTQE